MWCWPKLPTWLLPHPGLLLVLGLLAAGCTTSASSDPALASLRRMSSAVSAGTACLYGRSAAVSASKMSATVMMRVCTGIALARRWFG